MLPDDSKIGRVLYAGDRWQIFSCTNGKVLLATPALAGEWCEAGLVEPECFGSFSFGDMPLAFIVSPFEWQLAPVDELDSPHTKNDALSFAVALRETRKVIPRGSLRKAIFLEQYSRMLPIDANFSDADDEHMFGKWLANGVEVSTRSLKRLKKLVAWMTKEDLGDVLKMAGHEIERRHDSLEAKKSGDPCQKSQESGSSKEFFLPGRTELELFFREHVIDIINNREKYRLMGIESPSAVILHGPPGCGKTFAVEKLVEYLDLPCYSIDSGSIGSPYIHATSKKIAEVFDRAIDDAPSIIVIDEMEAFLSSRNMFNSGIHHVEEVAEFLRRIPEALKAGVLIIGMTNMLDSIDKAICRRGRFDHVIEVGMPSRDEIYELFKALFASLPINAFCLDAVADSLKGRPLSDAGFVAREAARLAARHGKDVIDEECLNMALDKLPGEKNQICGSIGFQTGG